MTSWILRMKRDILTNLKGSKQVTHFLSIGFKFLIQMDKIDRFSTYGNSVFYGYENLLCQMALMYLKISGAGNKPIH